MLKSNFDLSETVMHEKLYMYVAMNHHKVLTSDGEKVYNFEKILLTTSLRFEMIIYWTVYNFENYIVNLTSLNDIIQRMNESLYPLTSMQIAIEGYLKKDENYINQ